MTWIYAIPAWSFFIAAMIVSSALAVGGLLLFQRCVPQSEEVQHNDVAGPIIGTIGTILAVILSFLLVTVWQQYDGAAATAEQEASAVADLYHAASDFPQPVQRDLQVALRAYVAAVLHQEWPAMREGGRSASAREAESVILGIVAHYQPQTTAQQALQSDALTFVHTIQDSRRDRLFDNDQGIPTFFWVGNVLLAAVTVGFCYIFRVRKFSMHVIMTVALTLVISTLFVLIALFDYPFRGQTQIPPTTFQHLEDSINRSSLD